MFPMTMSFTITNADELDSLLQVVRPSQITKVTQPAEEVKKPASAPKAEVATAKPTAMAGEAAAPEPKAESSESKAYTIDDAKEFTIKIVADKGRDAAVNLLKKYGVPVAAKLQADQIQDFCTDAEKVLA